MLRLARRVCFCFFLVIDGPIKAAYVTLREDQAIRSSFSPSESGSGCAFTRVFFCLASESDGTSFTR